ncbi:precorrin-6y C5,15-methyltransferase (decarboxylating) subunit CbiE [Streptomyces sp. NPDC059740]|uniref:precorrin-6y C5,15-methyltransferase (decarboxylating) subunit CbiE n=1 Tax=Streptomyces sp. NPDC059740 TaxID=3346926 RepID=UPI0036463991
MTVVGIGADGWAGLTAHSRQALCAAEAVVGGARQLALLPPQVTAERITWPTPLRAAVPGLVAELAGRRVAVLASGDPSFHGIARTLTEVLGPGRLHVLPHPSSLSYACARLGWPLEAVEVVNLVGRPVERLAAALYEGRRVLVLAAGPATPGEVAAVLCGRGFGATRVRVLEQLGGAAEHVHEETTAARLAAGAGGPFDPLNVVALECRRDTGERGAPDRPDSADARPLPRLGLTAGLPDTAYEHDGQLTKRHVRAATLAALAPAPGELLWDVGGGSGSIGVEWMRAHPACRAVAVERDAARAGRIVRNARHLGVPDLRVVTGAAPGALAGLPTPDAVFVGGGLTAPGLLEACWAALPAGGRLVANTVTLESEALLAQWYRRHGGELVRLAVASAVPVGGFTGWRQAMPVTQWTVVKPHPGPAGPPPVAPSPSAPTSQEPQ